MHDLFRDLDREIEIPKKQNFKKVTNPLNGNGRRNLLDKIIDAQELDSFDTRKKKVTKEPIEHDNEEGLHQDEMEMNNAYMTQYQENQRILEKKKESLKDSDSENENTRKKNLIKKSKKESGVVKSLRKKMEPYVKQRFTGDVDHEKTVLTEEDMQRKEEDFTRQFPPPPPVDETVKLSKKASSMITPIVPLSKKEFYEEAEKHAIVSNNNNQTSVSVSQEFVLRINDEARKNKNSALVYKFLQQETPKSNINSNLSINNSVLFIPTRTREEEDMYLRTPREGIDLPCCMGKDCEGNFIPGATKVTLAAFLTLEERGAWLDKKLVEKPRMCVMCSRYCTAYYYIQQKSQLQSIKSNWLMQEYQNSVDVAGEYDLSQCLLGSSSSPNGLFYPVVAHIKHYYTQERDGDHYFYRQTGYKYPQPQVFQ